MVKNEHGTRPGRKLGNLGNLVNFFQRISNPSFRFWLQGKIENSEMGKLGIIFPRFPRFPTFPSFRLAICSFFTKFFFSILKYRKSRSYMFLKIRLLKNVVIFIGRHPCCILSFKRLATYSKKRLQKRCFSANIANVLRIAFL